MLAGRPIGHPDTSRQLSCWMSGWTEANLADAIPPIDVEAPTSPVEPSTEPDDESYDRAMANVQARRHAVEMEATEYDLSIIINRVVGAEDPIRAPGIRAC